MAQPNFIAQALLHWMGEAEGWEVLHSSFATDTPLADFDEEGGLVVEQMVDVASHAYQGKAVLLPEGAFVSMFAAGSLRFHSYETDCGTEHDMDIEIAWSSTAVMNAEEKAALELDHGLTDEMIKFD